MDKGHGNPSSGSDQPPAYPGNPSQGSYPPQAPGYAHGYPAQAGYAQPQGGYPNMGFAAQQTNNVVVVQQQQPGVAMVAVSRGIPPKDYYGLSIFTLIFCNLICGLIALMCAKEARDKHVQGDSVGAQSASKNSLILNVVALVSGIVAYIIAIVLYTTTFSVSYAYYG